MTSLSIEDQIYLAIAYKATNVAAIARKIGVTRQTLHKKITRNSLKKEELCKIGKILGGEYNSYFEFPGGIILGDKMKRKKDKDAS